MKRGISSSNRNKIQIFKSECRSEMQNNGLKCSDPLVATGRVYRYSAEIDRTNLDKFYIANEGLFRSETPYLVCIYGRLNTNKIYEFRSWDRNTAMTDKELESLKKVREAMIKDVRNYNNGK
jgi:hypothetical protein